MTPSVGRIVHYRPGHGRPCEAAIITWISEAGLPTDHSVSLAVVVAPVRRGGDEGGIQLPFLLEVLDVPEDVENSGHANAWHWPERVGEPEGR